MNRSVWFRLKQSLAAAEQWYRKTPERSLNEAHEAAKAIQQLENKFARGQTIDLSNQGEGAVSIYFQTQIKKYLKTIRMRLTEYKFCSPILDTEPQASSPSSGQRIISPEAQEDDFTSEYTLSSDQYTSLQDSAVNLSPDILEKLQLIDSVLVRYEPWRLSPRSFQSPDNSVVLMSNSSGKNSSSSPSSIHSVQDSFFPTAAGGPPLNMGRPSSTEGNSFIPRSIFQTANRFRQELDPDPKTEEDVVRNFRTAKARTKSATRFLLLLVILPLLTQQISKAVLVGPAVDRVRGTEQFEVWVNPRIEAKFLTQLASFEEKLKFQSLITEIPRTSQETELALKEKAEELKQEFQEELKEPIKNIFADLFSLAVFTIIILTGQKEIAILKSFIDEIVYGLSDSAKAFIIILFTDVFVGFHSPHGWEVIIESTLEHFGLPLGQSFINMFIATFPVMLDTVFKYWIFRYLNQISPSAVATYKNMNE